jgi:hypothetical protein
MSPSKTDEKRKAPGKDTLAKAPKGTRLPVLWELVNTLGQITVTLIGVAVAVISYLSGATFIMCAIRAGVAMFGVGLILWLIYWMVARGSLDMMKSLYSERQQELARQRGVGNSMDFRG